MRDQWQKATLTSNSRIKQLNRRDSHQLENPAQKLEPDM
jgi:hypothetical protein